MRRLLTKKQVLTIPNLLSAIRLLLIPVIGWLYCEKQAYLSAVGVLILSGVTDVVDGMIARRCGMVSDFGKILDPIADKLTQGIVLIFLTSRYPLMLPLVIVFAVKELLMIVMGACVLKQADVVNSSQWHGKLTTVLLYTVMGSLILFPTIPLPAANALIALCVGAVLLSFALYCRFYVRLLSEIDR